MITVGLTGSIAMGKSEVANVFRTAGIPVFDADQEVHKFYDSQAGVDHIQPLVPSAIVNGIVDRKSLTAAVLADQELLNRLEKSVHEEINRRRKAFLKKQEAQGRSIAIVDVPLLFEKSGDKYVDVTIVVSAPLEQQRQRALARPGMTEAKLDMIMQRQMPDVEKRRRADHVIENNGSLSDLEKKTLAVLAAIRKQHSL